MKLTDSILNKFESEPLKQSFEGSLIENLRKQEDALLKRLDSFETEDRSFSEMAEARNEQNDWSTEVAPFRQEIKTHSLHLLREVQASLKKLEKGSFGRCDRCSGEIEQERLRVIPTARRCSSCI